MPKPTFDIITFFDIPSQKANEAWSPNTWKGRYTLNIKGLPYKTEWVEYPDIEKLYKEVLKLPAPASRPDGSPLYTLPAIRIHNPTTNTTTRIADSLEIAKYLDEHYPEYGPVLLPKELKVLLSAFEDVTSKTFEPLQPLIKPETHAMLNKASQEYFYRTKGIAKYKEQRSAEGIVEEQWKQLEASLGTMEGWLKLDDGKYKYVAGDVITWADVLLASRLIYMMKAWGEGSEAWKRVAGWNGGRWVEVPDRLKAYETVV